MYNEIILESLRGIDTEGKTELDISTILSQALTDANHPDTICLGIFNGGERKFEGAVMNGLDMSTGPLLRFTYDWDTDEFNEL